MPSEHRRTGSDADAQQQMDGWLDDTGQRMQKSIDALHKEFGAVRAGRATPALVDRVMVDYYGAMTPLQQLAGINAPEPRLLVISPYDRGSIGAIEKGIQKSDLGLNPSNDGQVIRIAIPQLTEDRRKDMVKVVRKKAEEARVAIRNIRRDEVDRMRRLDKQGEVSADEVERHIAEVQKVTDRFIAAVEDLVSKKEAEILEV